MRRRRLIICTHHQISSADYVKDDEVGGACGTHGRGEKSMQGFGWKARKKETSRKIDA
jgi:hypothetical protein